MQNFLGDQSHLLEYARCPEGNKEKKKQNIKLFLFFVISIVTIISIRVVVAVAITEDMVQL